MRGARWLLLLAIAVILFGVGLTYRKQKKAQRPTHAEASQPMPPDTSSVSSKGGWTFKDHKTGCKTVDILFDSMSRASDSSRTDLKGAKLLLYHKRGGGGCEARYDLVESATANYFDGENRLYADGEVTIALGERSDPDAPASLVSIKSSGVTFDTLTGHADTDRPTTFVFKNGEGRATGATYDPPTRELFMKNDVKIDWQGKSPNAKPLHIEAPTLAYHEASKEIDLLPTGRLVHGEAVFEGDSPVIHMQDDGKGHREIKEVDGSKVHGVDILPTRKLQYSADRVWVDYNQAGHMEKIAAEGNSRVASSSEFAETTVTAHRVDLYFDPGAKESVLTNAVCNGHAVVESKPLPGAREMGESHVMRSESIDMKMQPGGRDVQTVASHVPGTLEFLPNLPAQHHRVLDGREMLIAYGQRNRIDTFHASEVKTTTNPNEGDRQHNRGIVITTSRELTARFDPANGHLASMDQTGNFTYLENDHKASAAKASLDGNQNVIVLDTGTSISDPTGSTSADHIRLDQGTGDFTAEGNVSSTRLPNQDQKKSSQMLSGDSPVRAQARKMESTNHNRHTRYEGNASLQQGANRITANTIDIDSERHGLVADGNVASDLWEQPKPGSKKDTSAVLTKVRAPHLVYTDSDRLAFYSGGVKMDRQGMLVQSRELRAWLGESGSDSRLDRAVADGAVDITATSKEQGYHTNSEHAEFYTCDPAVPKADPKTNAAGQAVCPQKLLLKGGDPTMVSTGKGAPTTIHGSELTYFPNDDRLLVNGDPHQGINTRVQAKRK